MTTSPSATLRVPEASDPIPDLAEYTLGLASAVSAGFWFHTVWGICGLPGDPFGWWEARLAGDWEGVQRAGRAIGNLATFNRAFADRIAAHAGGLRSSWSGSGAASAVSYLERLEAVLREQVQELEGTGQQLVAASSAMYEAAQTISGLLELLVDETIIATCELVTALLSSANPVATAASWTLFALQITKIITASSKSAGGG